MESSDSASGLVSVSGCSQNWILQEHKANSGSLGSTSVYHYRS